MQVRGCFYPPSGRKRELVVNSSLSGFHHPRGITMSTHNIVNLSAALEALQACQAHLEDAYLTALIATSNLTGARNTRGVELANKACDALTHCERLITVVTGDLRAEQN
jgi:hypothetical protein